MRTALRYGENPQSRAAFYLARADDLPEQLWGKALSYNNLLDLDATLRLLVRARVPLDEAQRLPAAPIRAAVVKHTVPCGVAERDEVAVAIRDALDADAISAYGGVIAVDGTIDESAAEELAKFLPRDRRRARVHRRRPGAAAQDEEPAHHSLRAVVAARLAAELRVRSALGGVLAEDDDPSAPPRRGASCRAAILPTAEWRDLRFAWDVVRHVKSNGVVMTHDGVTRGICAGQTNRVSAVRIAGERAEPGPEDAASGDRARVRERRVLSVRRRARGRSRRRLQRGHRAAGIDPRRQK